MDIDDNKKILELIWRDVYDLNVYASSSILDGLLAKVWAVKLGNGRLLKEKRTMERMPRRTGLPSSRKL
jgi:hypothetical protein